MPMPFRLCFSLSASGAEDAKGRVLSFIRFGGGTVALSAQMLKHALFVCSTGERSRLQGSSLLPEWRPPVPRIHTGCVSRSGGHSIRHDPRALPARRPGRSGGLPVGGQKKCWSLRHFFFSFLLSPADTRWLEAPHTAAAADRVTVDGG